MRPPRLRIRRSTWIAAFLVPIGVAMLAALLAAREPAALVAPLLGPWAGWLLGHGECSYAAFAKRPSFGLLVFGPGCFFSWRHATDDAIRELLAVLLWFWMCLWLATGVVSVLNSRS